jgi:hypothetical protein
MKTREEIKKPKKENKRRKQKKLVFPSSWSRLLSAFGLPRVKKMLLYIHREATSISPKIKKLQVNEDQTNLCKWTTRVSFAWKIFSLVIKFAESTLEHVRHGQQHAHKARSSLECVMQGSCSTWALSRA